MRAFYIEISYIYLQWTTNIWLERPPRKQTDAEEVLKQLTEASICSNILETLIDLFPGHVSIPGIVFRWNQTPCPCLWRWLREISCAFLFCQEASSQESRREGNGPGGELPAKIPAGEGPVPESGVPDLLPAAWTGTWRAGAQNERLLKFQVKNIKCSLFKVTICRL